MPKCKDLGGILLMNGGGHPATDDNRLKKLNVMKRQFIVTAPIDSGRHELGKVCYTNSAFTQADVTKIMESKPDFQLWDLIDFVEYCNDQEFDVEAVWMQAITVEVPDGYSPNTSTWYMDLIRF